MNDNHKHTILVIDDEEFILSSLNRLLRKEYNVLLAKNAADGLKLMQAHEVQVVITDQRMPGMDGVEFLSIVKGEYPDAIRMLLTGYADLQSVIAAVNTGNIYRYMMKPWEPEELLLSIRDAVEKYELIFQNRQLTQKLLETNTALEMQVEERTARLSRANAFITTLNQVVIQMQSDLYLEQVNMNLARELEILELESLVVIGGDDDGQDGLEAIQSLTTHTSTLQSDCPILIKEIRSSKTLVEDHQPEYIPHMRGWVEQILCLHEEEIPCCSNQLTNTSAISKGMLLPMVTRHGFLGALILWGDKLREDDMAPLTMFANQLAVILENARFFASMKLLAEIDSLTKVLNRHQVIKLAHKEIKRASRLGHEFSVVMIDLDRFKQVNDTFGHAVGDLVLRSTASVMQDVLRKDVDYLGRYGGDEFVVILPETGFTDAKRIAARLQESVQMGTRGLVAGLREVQISVGVASLAKENDDLDKLLEEADHQMYVNKKGRKEKGSSLPEE